mgnify:CR=1 FL=1
MAISKKEQLYAENYLVLKDKHPTLWGRLRTTFPRVYVPLNLGGQKNIYAKVNPIAAPAFQMAFRDIGKSMFSFRKGDGDRFTIESFPSIEGISCLDPYNTPNMQTLSTKCMQSPAITFKCYVDSGGFGTSCKYGLDYHTFGVVLDVNPKENFPIHCSQASMIDIGRIHQLPLEFIGIMKRYGFVWGGDALAYGCDANAIDPYIRPSRFTLAALPIDVWKSAESGGSLGDWYEDPMGLRPAISVMEAVLESEILKGVMRNPQKIFKRYNLGS